MNYSLKNLTIEEIESLHEYLEHNPAYDMFGEEVTMDDLEVNTEMDIIYPFSWLESSESNDSTGHNMVSERFGTKYAMLITKKQLDAEVKSNKENANQEN